MAVMDRILIQHYQSPCGELILGSFGDKLCMCDWVDEKRRGIIDKRMQDGLHASYETGSSEVKPLPNWMNTLRANGLRSVCRYSL